jgi:BMFP domain-containing protein YqiC
MSDALTVEWPHSLNNIREEVEEFIRPQLRHHVSSADDVELDAISQGWISTAYAALLELKSNPRSKPAMHKLDQIKEQFDATAPVLRYFTQEICTARREINRLEALLTENSTANTESRDEI